MGCEKYNFSKDKLIPINTIINQIESNFYIDSSLGYEDGFELDSILYYLKETQRLKQENSLYKNIVNEIKTLVNAHNYLKKELGETPKFNLTKLDKILNKV